MIRAYLGTSDMLMCVSDLSVAYGRITALDDVSVDVDAGEIVSIIGANGAGKSTLLKTVAGILKPTGRCDHSSRKKRSRGKDPTGS